MGFYALVFLSFFLMALILRIRRSAFYALAELSLSLVNDLMARESDEVKLQQVQKSTGRLVRALLLMLAVMGLAIGLGSIPLVAYALVTGTGYRAMELSSFPSILSLSAGASLAFVIPLGHQRHSDYSELSQLLHRMALNNYTLAERLFKGESKRMARPYPETREDFVIVSGLARAGTTSLMNDLAAFPRFATLNYGNMPFLMCPNLWRRFYKPRNSKLRERSHKDGIMIGLDSNEALEEYFFKVKAADAYMDHDQLHEYALEAEDYADYLDYQRNIKKEASRIYLAKNNNFILRYRSMRSFNEAFLMVFLVRDPLSHAASLMEKHREYQKMQQADPFILEYMDWLGHHEFGLHQKVFRFSRGPILTEGNRESLDYWLEVWINYYRQVLEFKHPRTLVIAYEHYCRRPAEVIGRILEAAGMDAPLPDYPAFQNRRKAEFDYSAELYQKAQGIYEALLGAGA